MQLIFCSDPIRTKHVDDAFAAEAQATRAAGFPQALVDFEALIAGDISAATRRIAAGGDEAIYRGWMLSAERYAELHQALADRGIRLINDPGQYRYAHHLPESYADLAGATPESVFIPRAELDWHDLPARLRGFGDRPLIVRDWVKSRKHEWDEACFIPSAADATAVERVARRFIELQDDQWTGGLVFRAFERFEPLAAHAQSGMPMSKEFRLFFLDGKLLLDAHYWEGAEYGDVSVPSADFTTLAARLRSRFFTMDVAQRTDGVWRVVEIGDAQVSGLPEDQDPAKFYGSLRALMK